MSATEFRAFDVGLGTNSPLTLAVGVVDLGKQVGKRIAICVHTRTAQSPAMYLTEEEAWALHLVLKATCREAAWKRAKRIKAS